MRSPMIVSMGRYGDVDDMIMTGTPWTPRHGRVCQGVHFTNAIFIFDINHSPSLQCENSEAYTLLYVVTMSRDR
jgi:hypothetical protein